MDRGLRGTFSERSRGNLEEKQGNSRGETIWWKSMETAREKEILSEAATLGSRGLDTLIERGSAGACELRYLLYFTLT